MRIPIMTEMPYLFEDGFHHEWSEFHEKWVPLLPVVWSQQHREELADDLAIDILYDGVTELEFHWNWGMVLDTRDT